MEANLSAPLAAMLATLNPECAPGAPSQWELNSVVDASVKRYIDERRQQIRPFCHRHFSLRGTFRLHRLAVGHDLWRAPANVLWSVPFLVSRGTAGVLAWCGWPKAAKDLRNLPAGFQTRVAREIEWLLYTELLELPVEQADRSAQRDRLLETILADENLAQWLLADLAALHRLTRKSETRDKLEEYLNTYTRSRTAAAELSGSLLSIAAGAAAFHEFTPGAFAVGGAAATTLAQQIAIAHFALGPTLGSLYYGLFPATASPLLLAGAVGGSMAILGIMTAFSGVVSDPIQLSLGLHERRLNRLLTAVERRMTGIDGDFRLRDAYAARVFDLIDLIKGAVRFVHG